MIAAKPKAFFRSLITAVALVAAGGAFAQGKPNILVIWGDDIGQFNISAYNRGMMGYKTPNIDSIASRGRAVHRLVRPAELHRRPCGVHHRAVADPHRTHQGRPAGRAGRHEEGRPDDRHAAEGTGLRDRPVRQEPPRRSRRHAADGAWLRRVLRQSLPPERRGGAGEPGLPEERGVQEEVRPARRHSQLRGRHHRHRSADPQAHGDDRRGGDGQGARLHGACEEGGQAVLPVVELHPDAHLHAPEGDRTARRGWASTPTAWSSTTATSGRCWRS